MFSLIITSTVYVNSNNTLLVDPDQRLRQYIESILFYLEREMVLNIIVCDNSNFDYSVCKEFLNKTFKKEIEFLHFAGDTEQTVLKGKGYGEGQIMEYVLANSRLLRHETSFCKVTGRIFILNIDAILKKTDHKVNYFQRIGINPFTAIKKVDTRFYHCTVETFRKYLLNSFFLVNDNEGCYLEHVYYNQLNTGQVGYKNFNRLPHVEGLSGSTGETYNIKRSRWFLLKNIYAILNFMDIRTK